MRKLSLKTQFLSQKRTLKMKRQFFVVWTSNNIMNINILQAKHHPEKYNDLEHWIQMWQYGKLDFQNFFHNIAESDPSVTFRSETFRSINGWKIDIFVAPYNQLFQQIFSFFLKICIHVNIKIDVPTCVCVFVCTCVCGWCCVCVCVCVWGLNTLIIQAVWS